MSIRSVAKVVGDTPFMSREQAKRMTGLIKSEGLARVLELGFAHGVSTCYIADAVKDMPQGSVTAIDLTASRDREPPAEELLDRCGLSGKVDLIREPRSFTWRLMNWLEEGRRDCFDLVYLDGGHTWDVTGFAFFLVDRLLVPGGWLVFDDIDWTYASSPISRRRDAPGTCRRTSGQRRRCARYSSCWWSRIPATSTHASREGGATPESALSEGSLTRRGRIADPDAALVVDGMDLCRPRSGSRPARR